MSRRCHLAPRLAAALVAGLTLGGCAGTIHPPALGVLSPASWSWFADPADDDPWRAPIADWQTRETAAAGASMATTPMRPPPPATAVSSPTPAAVVTPLTRAWHDFRAEQRRSFARDLTTWIQERSEEHFIPDVGKDHWPTFDEVLARGADDCDGLALLTYRLLREFGFGNGEVYQAIVRADADGQLHMVTLWFEDPQDPWVLDPTAAMVKAMVRMSDVPGWRPLELFTENEHFAVRLGTMPDVASPPPAGETAAP